MNQAIPTLRERFGDRISMGVAIRDQHGRGESYHPGMPPDAVFFAQTTAEVAEAAAFCREHDIPIIAFGAGTSLEGNVSAVHGGLCIDLSGMNRILRVSPKDLDCTVEAGVTRLQLNRELRDTGLFFPLDPGADATIGGMAATRASGTNAVRYGTMRDTVLALTVVLADGSIIRTGSRARKSAAGYDLTRLFVGSEGTLGIITEVTLRLNGVPEAITAASCSFSDLDSAVNAVVAVIQSAIPVARMELMDEAQMRAVNQYSKTNYPISDTLLFEFHGSPLSVGDDMRRVGEIVDLFGGGGFVTASTQEERSILWKARHDAFYATTSLRPNSRGWSTDVCVPISNLAECIAGAQRALATTTVPATILGHVGDGNFHVIFAVDPENPVELGEVARINAQLIELALSLEGTCTGEHGIGTGKRAYMEREHGEGVRVMRLLKQALDPSFILNPGKILPDD